MNVTVSFDQYKPPRCYSNQTYTVAEGDTCKSISEKTSVDTGTLEILNNLYVSLSEFYDRVGLPHTKFSDEIGWNSDNLLELHFSSVVTPDQRPALAFSFHVDPIRKFRFDDSVPESGH